MNLRLMLWISALRRTWRISFFGISKLKMSMVFAPHVGAWIEPHRERIPAPENELPSMRVSLESRMSKRKT